MTTWDPPRQSTGGRRFSSCAAEILLVRKSNDPPPPHPSPPFLSPLPSPPCRQTPPGEQGPSPCTAFVGAPAPRTPTAGGAINPVSSPSPARPAGFGGGRTPPSGGKTAAVWSTAPTAAEDASATGAVDPPRQGCRSHETDVVVIGSGVGGLSAAAVLARHGDGVTVLESHYLPGGVAHAFDIRGYRFDAGPSLWAGMSESGTNPLRQILDILGESVRYGGGILEGGEGSDIHGEAAR